MAKKIKELYMETISFGEFLLEMAEGMGLSSEETEEFLECMREKFEDD
jgi:hypothetical protein